MSKKRKRSRRRHPLESQSDDRKSEIAQKERHQKGRSKGRKSAPVAIDMHLDEKVCSMTIINTVCPSIHYK